MKVLLLWTLLCSVALVASAETVDVTVRRAPYVISSVSAKSENAWVPCRYCGSKTNYERTYRWDVNSHVWIETTDRAGIPDVCRQCRAKGRDQEKLDMRERDLDRQIEYQKTRKRIWSKERQLERLRKEAR